MAEVRLSCYEIERDLLPNVCMCCGERATLRRSKGFAWHPPWVLILLPTILPFVLIAFALTKRMRVNVPLCQTHRHHWFKRNVFNAVGLAAIVLAAAGMAVLFIFLAAKYPYPPETIAYCWLVWFAVSMGWAILLAIFQLTAIRPVEITPRGMTLANVSPRFVAAMVSDRVRSDVPQTYQGQFQSMPRFRLADGFYDPEASPASRLSRPRF